ncbi:ATP-binding cassette domain-containing protein [Nonomuraea harbinensis]|uniref:ATP-binding cassette domain-containing protein n=1 Tax=Nonomuraea harbinensis TaxID=1286938 RepID=A0ABW1BKJ8_9ACTN|nr:ATP-binding cassette domain-containing protein [Nonomuraea harbinensis]
MRPLLEVRDLVVRFPLPRRRPWHRRTFHPAVDGVSFTVAPGETLGLVGESGSGKTTVGRTVLGLQRADSGTVTCGDADVTRFGRVVPTAYRRRVQAVFQDPYGSLNPTMVVADLVGEPLGLHTGLTCREREERVVELLELVGLSARHLGRYPYHFSGGQQQRIAIARALALEPELIILDEPVSALDVSIQSQVVNLLEDVQERTGVAYLFIAHDLAVVRHISDRIAVMHRGRLVEIGDADQVCDAPAHPYAQLLLASVLDADLDGREARRARRRELAASFRTAPDR